MIRPIMKDEFFLAQKSVPAVNCEEDLQVARDLLEDGKSLLRGCYSPKTGFYYDATVVMEDDGKQTRFRMDFGHK